jgi:hypothetical protein
VNSVANSTAPESPYKGLIPFAEEDAPFFFGREIVQDVIGANLQAYRLTLLYGTSGVGKSSVLRAGVAHHLRTLAERSVSERGVPEFVVVVFASWRDDPVATLLDRIRDSIAHASGALTTQLPPPSPTLADTFASWIACLDVDLLVVLDQFEEYFLYHPHDDGDGSLALELPRAIGRPGLRANFLISIREDSLAKLDRFKGRIPNLFDNYLRVDHLDRSAAQAAIEKPLAQFNRSRVPMTAPVSIEPALVTAVLNQIRAGRVLFGDAGRGTIAREAQEGSTEERIETPYLQLVMTRLWKEERAAGSTVLRLETLTRLGGADRIVRTHLDDVMSTLTAAERQAASRAFRYLVTPSGTKIAHTLSDLADYAALPQGQLEPIAEKLSSGDVRIIRPVAPSPDRPTVPRYEIFHDVLAPAILDWQHRTEVEHRSQVERTLEPLHGGAWSLARWLILSSVLVAMPLTAALTTDPESPTLLPGWFLSAIAFMGVLALFLSFGQLLRVTGQIIHAVAVGFRWRMIADVLADQRGDLGDLVAMAGLYRDVSARRADRIRILRRVDVALALSATSAPLAALLVVVSLGSRGGLAPATTPTVVLAPFLVLVTCGIAVRCCELLLSRWARSSSNTSNEPSARHRPRRATSDWFEGIHPDPPRLSSARRARWVAWLMRVAVVALGVTAALLVLPVAAVTALGPMLSQIAIPQSNRVQERARILAVAQPYRVPVDPAISPIQAGGAYYVLGEIGRSGPGETYDLPPPRSISEGWIPDQARSPFGDEDILERLVAGAHNGFDAKQTLFLEQIASHSGFAETSLVARAARIDYLGARLIPNHLLSGFQLPIPNLSAMRRAGRAHLARAALELSRGQQAEAENTLREGISLGWAVATEGHTLIEVLVGAALVESGLKGLEDFYSTTGRASQAGTLRRDREAVTGLAADDQNLTIRDEYRRPDEVEFRRVMSRIARDPQRLQGERWEAINFLSVAPCLNPQELTFGPTDDLRRTVEIVRTNLPRFPSEQRFLENILATSDLSEGTRAIEIRGTETVMTGILSRGFDLLFGTARVTNCGRLLTIALFPTE